MQDESYCDLTCVGDSSVACGGPLNAVNVYKVDGGCATTATESTSTASTDGPTVSTTEDVVTSSPATTPEV